MKSENTKNTKSVMAFNSPSASDEKMVGFCSSFEASLGLPVIVWSHERSSVLSLCVYLNGNLTCL